MGFAWLISALEEEKIMVAFPERDSGIDLIAYQTDDRFRAVPIQVKTSSKRGFYTNKKYLKINGLKIVYIWNLARTEEIEAFALNYPDAERIVDVQGRSRKNGIYFAQASSNLLLELGKFRVSNWSNALFDEKHKITP
jgi:hypothetical protein